jgi:hypothetical protein
VGGTSGRGVQRVAVDHDRQAGLVGQALVEAPQQRSPAGERHAVLHDVGRQLGRGGVDDLLHGVDHRHHRPLERLPDLGRRRHDRAGQAGDEVPAPDLGVVVVGGVTPRRPGRVGAGRTGRADLDLELLGRPLPEGQAVLLLDPVDDRLVEVHPAQPERLPGHDPAERQDGDLRPPAADHDDHAAPGVVDGEPDAERRGDVGLDQLDRSPAPRFLGRLLHGPLLQRIEAGGHHHDHLRPGPPPRVHLEEHEPQHPGADVDVGDHAVTDRPHDLDRRRSAPQHPPGFAADGHGPPVLRGQRDQGRLLQHDPAAGKEHRGRAGPQIDGRIPPLHQPALRPRSAPNDRAEITQV